MLPPGSAQNLPGSLPIDLFFLFYLPAALQTPALFWGGLVLLVALVGLFPWIIRRKPLSPVQISVPRCTGCTLCAADCPYKALRMVERSDGLPHKFVAVLDPALCVSCGVCIGSCPTLAISLGAQPPEAVWEQVAAQAASAGKPVSLVFTCERHALQGGAARLEPSGELQVAGQPGEQAWPENVRIIPLTCIGMAHPDLAERALAAGAAQVRFVGCPPEDCANREGNLWMQQRLERRRMPRLRLEAARPPQRVLSVWAAPNDFWRSLAGKIRPTPASAYEDLPAARWNARTFAPALLLMAGVLALQLMLSNVPYTPYPAQQAAVEISLEHRPGWPLKGGAQSGFDPQAAQNTRLQVIVDGDLALDRFYPPQGAGGQMIGFARLPLESGSHQVQVKLANAAGGSQVVFDQVVELRAGQVWRLALEDSKLSGDPQMGARLFNDQVFGARAGCTICHSLDPDVQKAGPSLAGIATRAASRLPGLSAEAYLRQSIMDPNAFIVPGFSGGQMPPTFGTILSEAQIQDIVAFLLTLK